MISAPPGFAGFFVTDSLGNKVDTISGDGVYVAHSLITNPGKEDLKNYIIRLYFNTRIGKEVIVSDKINLKKNDTLSYNISIPKNEAYKQGATSVGFILYRDTLKIDSSFHPFIFTSGKAAVVTPVPLIIKEPEAQLAMTNPEFYSYTSDKVIANSPIYLQVRLQFVGNSQTRKIRVLYEPLKKSQVSVLTNGIRLIEHFPEGDTLIMLNDFSFKIKQATNNQRIGLKVFIVDATNNRIQKEDTCWITYNSYLDKRQKTNQ